MPEDRTTPYSTLALETKVEEDFVAPLTAVRGSLEILRDFAELSDEERQRFLETALRGCARLEQAVRELSEAVYSAGDKAGTEDSESLTPDEYRRYSGRITLLRDIDTVEVDFSDFEFSNSKIVNDFYDVVEELIESSGRKWFFLVNYRNCRIWPEAWVAFAHRGKKVNASYSIGTLRYIEQPKDDGDATGPSEPDSFDPDLFPSRDLALKRLEELRRAGSN